MCCIKPCTSHLLFKIKDRRLHLTCALLAIHSHHHCRMSPKAKPKAKTKLKAKAKLKPKPKTKDWFRTPLPVFRLRIFDARDGCCQTEEICPTLTAHELLTDLTCHEWANTDYREKRLAELPGGNVAVLSHCEELFRLSTSNFGEDLGRHTNDIPPWASSSARWRTFSANVNHQGPHLQYNDIPPWAILSQVLPDRAMVFVRRRT